MPESNVKKLADALQAALYTIKALDEDYDSRDSYIQGRKVLREVVQSERRKLDGKP